MIMETIKKPNTQGRSTVYNVATDLRAVKADLDKIVDSETCKLEDCINIANTASNELTKLSNSLSNWIDFSNKEGSNDDQ